MFASEEWSGEAFTTLGIVPGPSPMARSRFPFQAAAAFGRGGMPPPKELSENARERHGGFEC